MPLKPSPVLWDHPPRELARALFQDARDAILLLDRDRRVLDANPACAALLGRATEALVGSVFDEWFDAPTNPSRAATVRLRSGAWVRLSFNPLERLLLVTLRPEVPTEDRFRKVVEGSIQGILIHQDDRFVYANPALARMFGYDGPADIVGRALWDTFATPEHLDLLQARTAAIYAGEPVPPHPGWRAVGKDGRRVWVSTAASLIEWNGRPAVASFFLDISEQKRVEDSLRASERFVHAIAGASPLTMYVFDRTEGRNIWANRQITADLGYTPEEVRDMGPDFLARLLHPDDLAKLPGLLARWDTAADDETLETEYRMRHADGTWRWFVGHDTVFARDPDGRVRQFLGTTQDVTARKRAEEKTQRYRDMLESIRHAQAQFLVDRNTATIFDGLLRDLLALTDSEYGFIGEVLHTAEGQPYLKTHAITNIAWSEETRRLYDANAPTGLEFLNLQTLFGEVLTTGKPVMTNDPSRDPRRGGLPQGHPDLLAFLGLPFHYGDQLVGMVGIANRPGGYDADTVEYLQPFLSTCAHLVEAYRTDRHQRQTDEALRHSRALYHSLVENLPVSLFTKDREGRFLFANARFCELAGVSLDQLLGKTDADLWPPELAAVFRADDLRVIETGRLLEKEEENRLSDGTPVHVQVIKTPVRGPNGDVVGVQGVFWDVTARKRAEEERRQSEARLRAILESEPECVKLLDREGRLLEMNEAGLKMVEADTIRDVRGHCVYPLVADEYRGAFEELTRAGFRGESGTLEFELIGLRGTHRWLDTHSTPLRGADGNVTAVLSVTRDITARKRAEEERRQSEARLAAMVANSPGMAIQWYDSAGRVVLWNRASEQMFGYTAAEALGRTLDQLIHTPEEFAVFRETCAAIARTSEPVPPTEYTFRRRSGEQGTCLSTLFAIPGPAGAHWFVCMDIDITERKRAEEERQRLEAQVRQSQKLESLGVLAGGIAHDFNNLLTSVLGYSSLAAMDVPAGSAARPMLHEIEKAAQRAAELTQQMLAYSGRGKFVVRAVGLDGLVREMNKLLQTVVSKKAVIHLELAAATIEADATQIRQVVMNLLTNASDALEDRPGEIAVRTGTRHLDADALRSPFVQTPLPPGEYAFLEVVDSGCGMSEETLARIFDPFFTTKFTGRGLGLAAVLGIIRGHGGSLQIATAPGQGTTFRIYFPCVAAVPERAAIAQAAAPPRGHGLVLVVDDEENVRTYVRRVLDEAGFRVLIAGDGAEALSVLREHRGAVRAVVLDLTMPQLDGWEVAGQLQTEEPGLPVVLMSGYSEPELGRREGRANVAGFIQKPFRPSELLDIVCRLARQC